MMTRMVPMLLATGLVAVGLSCPAQAETDVALYDDAIVVTLKVPNMT